MPVSSPERLLSVETAGSEEEAVAAAAAAADALADTLLLLILGHTLQHTAREIAVRKDRGSESSVRKGSAKKMYNNINV